MHLEDYQKKRDFQSRKRVKSLKCSEAERQDFKTTPEPMFKMESHGSKTPIFVVHEHHAFHLHWDLRLEREGVLKSWAVPKEPPLAQGLKRLAIEVGDHPLEYAEFEGRIPEGQYGAGKVIIWDSGTYIPEKFSENEIIAEFNGKKLNGKYVLIKTAFKGAKNNWLFFKKGLKKLRVQQSETR